MATSAKSLQNVGTYPCLLYSLNVDQGQTVWRPASICVSYLHDSLSSMEQQGCDSLAGIGQLGLLHFSPLCPDHLFDWRSLYSFCSPVSCLLKLFLLSRFQACRSVKYILDQTFIDNSPSRNWFLNNSLVYMQFCHVLKSKANLHTNEIDMLVYF